MNISQSSKPSTVTVCSRRRALAGTVAAGILTLSSTSAFSSESLLFGAIGAAYRSNVQMRSELGEPLATESASAYGGAYQVFSGGRAYWHPSTGAWWVRHGGIFDFFHSNGGVEKYGYPTSNVYVNSRGINGWSLTTYHPRTGARFSLEWENTIGVQPIYLNGGIGHTWAANKQSVGFPKNAEQGLSDVAAYQQFSGGLAYWNTSSGTSFFPYGTFARTGAQNYLRRTDFVLGPKDALVIADSQANLGGTVAGVLQDNDPSWISQGLRSVGYTPVHYSYGAVGAVASKWFFPSFHQGVVGNAFALPVGSPGLIYLGGSGNDLWVGLNYHQVSQYYLEIIATLRRLYPGARILLSEVLGRRINEQRNRAELSAALASAGASVGVSVVPCRYWVSDYGLEHLLNDAVHLSDAGHTALGKRFANWLRSSSLAADAFRLVGAIGNYYHRYGGASHFGQPTQNEFASVFGGAVQNFSNKWAIYWHERTGAHSIKWGTAIGNRYQSERWELGYLGYPATDEYAYAYGAAQEFYHPSTGYRAIILWSEKTGARMVNQRGAIHQLYLAAGGASRLGFPVVDEARDADGVVRVRYSSGAVISWTESRGVWISY
ncbi:GDSL-type esterase/lipase family protein [Rothia sp. 88186D007BW]